MRLEVVGKFDQPKVIMRKEVVVATIGAVAAILAAGVAGIFSYRGTNDPPVLLEFKPSNPSPQFAGAMTRWTAKASDPDDDKILYRFWLKDSSGSSRIEQEWSSQSWWDWSPLEPGSYRVGVSVRDGSHATPDQHDDQRTEIFIVNKWTSQPDADNPEGLAQEWVEKGVALRDLGRFEEAAECYAKALDINPNDFDVWNKRGYALHRAGRYNEAMECYDKAIEIDPTHSSAWNNKAAILQRLGRYQEAIKCYDEAIRLDPSDSANWNNKCSLLRIESIGRYAEAVSACERALKLDPTNALAWNNKGGALFSLERYAESLEAHKRAAEIDPEFAEAWYNEGTAFHMLGKYREAIQCYDKALSLDPTHVAALNAKAEAQRKLKGS